MPRTFLARAQETSGKAHPQRTTTFFSPITPTNATSQSRDTQMGPRLGHKKGVTTDRAIAIFRACRPQPHGPRPQEYYLSSLVTFYLLY